jgi:hypothetical protein
MERRRAQMTMNPTIRRVLLAPVLAAGVAGAAEPTAAQWIGTHEQFYLPARHNWVFRRDYPQADRLFNAFDYGHAILYEELWRRPQGPVARLEEREYDFITRRLLVSPPRIPLEESAIEVAYARLVPEAKLMFEWAHLLHRQIYDVLADERLDAAQKDAAVAELIAYYKTRPDLAFSSRPKSMELMEGQYYATAFREAYPKFNGLIWAYHWMQVGLYEPLLTGTDVEARQAGVTAAVTRFRQMLQDAPRNMPRVMPMTAAVAPAFASRYPEAAIIFDNLHGMHDVISDILASPRVPRERKREEILRAAARYRDDTSFLMTEAEWREMAAQMGVQNMGGPVTGFLAGFPEPTLERGAVMAHGAGGHAGHDAAAPAVAAPSEHAGHEDTRTAAPAPAPAHQHEAVPAPTEHEAMQPAAPDADHAAMAELHEMHVRLMQDPVIRQRMMADTALHGMMMRMMERMPAEHRAEMLRMMHGGDAGHAEHGAAASPGEVERGLDFVARLLSDPEVAARVHADPELHRLWSDPEVQRRLAELRARQAPAAPAHDHH